MLSLSNKNKNSKHWRNASSWARAKTRTLHFRPSISMQNNEQRAPAVTADEYVVSYFGLRNRISRYGRLWWNFPKPSEINNM